MKTVLAFLVLGVCVCVGAKFTKCFYDGHYHQPGDRWTTIERCNHCHCGHQGMICSADECNLKQFAKPNATRLLNCNSEGDWYDVHDFWKLKDGCNTCYCKVPGNFRGLQVCTTTDCSLVIG